jgi:hypothetical protein
MMTTVKPWMDAIEALPTSTAIRESIYGYPALLSAHIVGMCLFAGLVLMMDLRLVGVGNLGTPFSQLQKRLFPWQVIGMVLSAITGAVLVYGQPTRYYTNVFFWLKMVMMVLAGVNALAFHRSTYHSVAVWDASRILPSGAKLAGIVSVVLWAAVVVVGRMIAYNWFVLR